jgi:hypothetical protein
MAGWAASVGLAGNVEGLDFLGDRHREDDRLFTAITDFVDAGSSIHFEIESGCSHWFFERRQLHDQEGRSSLDDFPTGGGDETCPGQRHIAWTP